MPPRGLWSTTTTSRCCDHRQRTCRRPQMASTMWGACERGLPLTQTRTQPTLFHSAWPIPQGKTGSNGRATVRCPLPSAQNAAKRCKLADPSAIPAPRGWWKMGQYGGGGGGGGWGVLSLQTPPHQNRCWAKIVPPPKIKFESAPPPPPHKTHPDPCPPLPLPTQSLTHGARSGGPRHTIPGGPAAAPTPSPPPSARPSTAHCSARGSGR